MPETVVYGRERLRYATVNVKKSMRVQYIAQDFKTVRAKSALSTYIYEYLHRAGFALTVLKSCHIYIYDKIYF